MEKEKKITNSIQLNKLVEEMEKNSPLAKGFQKGNLPSDFKEQWEIIATILNALGPPKRSGDGWQKVWRDLKFKVKKKLVANKPECTSTGGGIYKQMILSPLEEAVANLLQFQKQLNPKGSVQGVECIEYEDVVIEVVESNKLVPQNESELLPASTYIQSAENCTPLRRKEKSTSKKPGSNNDHYELLQKHSDKQANILKEINNSMSSMKRTLKDLSRYQKDLLEIEKKKYQLLTEQHESEMKIKEIKLLIKEKELEGLNKS